MKYISQWISDWYDIFTREFRHIFSDSGVMVIFFLAGLAYPLLYGLIYRNGTVDDMPIAVVDDSSSAGSREFVRALDATREISVAFSCADMDEAERLLQQRKVKGIVMIPSDYEECLASGRQAHVSTYADMSSFLYYKNLTMGASQVMLSEMHDIQASRFSSAGYDGQQIRQLVQPLKYEENMPYNRNFSYSIFFLSAVLLIVVQQTMFYGVSMLTGTMREENRSFAVLPDRLKGHGPQNCPFGEIFILLLFYVSACVVFSFTFSSLIRHRETVFVLFLFMSPICLFLTGFSWPAGSFPGFWKVFSYLFPSTFAVRAFINMNTAGASLAMAAPQVAALTIQIIIYYFLSCMSVFIENQLLKRRQKG